MTPPLLDRADEIAALQAAVEDLGQERGSVVVIEGPAGIGKTVLLDAATAHAAALGVRVLRARASELERDVSHGVVHQLLQPPLAAADPAERERLLGGAAGGAAFLLPGATGEPDDGFATVHGLHWLTLGLAEAGPLLIAVDDLHWTDALSLRFLEHLGRRLDGTRIGVIATTRPAEPGAAQDLLDELAAGPSARILRPGPLGGDAVATVLTAALGAVPEPAFTDAAAEATGGNPLLTSVLASEAAAAGLQGLAAERDELAALGGRGVERMVRRRLRALGPDCEALAKVAAIAGDDLSAADAARLTGLDPASALDARDALVRADVLDGDAFAFTHPLVRAATLAACPPSERARLHGALAALLTARGARLAQVAQHLVHTAPAGDADTTALLREAARSAAGEGAPDVAVDLLRRALDEPPTDDERPSLLLDLGELEIRTGRAEGPGRLRALLGAGLAGDDAARAHAALAAHLVHNDPVAALDELDRAAVDATDPALALQLEARALEALIYVDAASVATRRDARFEVDLDEVGASPALAVHVAIDRACRGAPAGEVIAAAKMAAGSDRLLSELGPGNSTWNLLTHAFRLAERADDARRLLEDGARVAHAQRLHEATLFVEHGWGYWHRDFGSVATGAARSAVGLDVIRQLGMELTTPALAAILAENLVAIDRVEDALTHIDIPLDHLAGTYVEPYALSARAHTFVAARRGDDAERDLRRLVEIDRGRGWDAPHVTRGRMRLTLLLARTGRAEEALALSDLDVAAAERIGLPGVRGMVLRARAAALDGEDAVDTLRAAVLSLEPTPLRREYGWALHDLGARLRVRGDRRDARVPLRAALDVAGETESTRLARHARAELEASGSRLGREQLGGVAGLTPSERRVADMAAEGLTNREIAQTLWVTPKTVEMHLGRVYGKLAIRSRRELGAALGSAVATGAA